MEPLQTLLDTLQKWQPTCVCVGCVRRTDKRRARACAYASHTDKPCAGTAQTHNGTRAYERALSARRHAYISALGEGDEGAGHKRTSAPSLSPRPRLDERSRVWRGRRERPIRARGRRERTEPSVAAATPMGTVPTIERVKRSVAKVVGGSASTSHLRARERLGVRDVTETASGESGSTAAGEGAREQGPTWRAAVRVRCRCAPIRCAVAAPSKRMPNSHARTALAKEILPRARCAEGVGRESRALEESRWAGWRGT